MENSLKDIFQKNYSSLCNYASAIVRDKHAAEDIVQSVFVKLWETSKIEQLKKPDVYLLKCVRFKCIDYLRRPKRRQEVLMDALPDVGLEAPNVLKEEDILPLLQYFASKLPPRMRQVFLMSRQQEMSYKEIAQELNISVKTVENQMGTALKKLRILLQQHHYLPVLVLFFQ